MNTVRPVHLLRDELLGTFELFLGLRGFMESYPK